MIAEPRTPFELPIKKKCNRRIGIINKYARLLWRKVNTGDIENILSNLYEDAYSNGLKDMDKMHKKYEK